jgi:adenylate kinase
MLKIYLFFGPPGSGKGTQSHLIQEKFGIKTISTGDIIRSYLKKDHPLSQEIKNYISTGKLVPSSLVNNIIKNELSNHNLSRVILDGYPRTIDQLDFLVKNIAKPILTIYFQIGLDKLIERICMRRICPKCNLIYHLIHNKPQEDNLCDKCKITLIQREDDKEEIVKKRYEVFINETIEVIEEIKKLNIPIYSIDATNEIKIVFSEISEIFKKYE